MKKNIFFWCQLFLFGLFVQFGYGQNVSRLLINNDLVEKISVQTDREVYSVEEYISFVAFNLTNQNLRDLNWSKVLYIEIITPKGKPIIQAKFEFDSNGSSGKILIPKEVLTGNYYLRAYTKWMRNYSQYSFFYKLITIINPYNNEFLQSSYIDTTKKRFTKEKLNRNDSINITTNKNNYNKREKAQVEIKLPESTQFLKYFTLSVIKKGIEQNFSYSYKSKAKNINTVIDFIPETRSISLTGRVINSTDSVPISFIPLNLTIFNSKNEPFRTITDKNGHFYFSLPPLTGEIEIFISVVNKKENYSPVILVDNDYCTKNIDLPFIPFKIDSTEKILFEEMCINSQLSEIYKIMASKMNKTNSKTDIPFYGLPTSTIILDDYVELPTLADYFNELLPYVSINRNKNKRYFKILGPYSELKIYDPLVLVDFVAISNIDWVLSINPKKIEKIDVVELPFVRGNANFGGIINIISKDKDFAGVNLPSSGKFFSYEMFSDFNIGINIQDTNKRIPDLRNTLLWESFLCPNNNTLSFNFITGDSSGKYIAFLRGFDKNNNEVMNYCTFEVK